MTSRCAGGAGGPAASHRYPRYGGSGAVTRWRRPKAQNAGGPLDWRRAVANVADRVAAAAAASQPMLDQ